MARVQNIRTCVAHGRDQDRASGGEVPRPRASSCQHSVTVLTCRLGAGLPGRAPSITRTLFQKSETLICFSRNFKDNPRTNIQHINNSRFEVLAIGNC